MNIAPPSTAPAATTAPFDNALLDAQFIATANLTAPLPAEWLYLPRQALYCRAIYQGIWLIVALLFVAVSVWFWPRSWLIWPAAVIGSTQLLGLLLLPITVKRQRYVIRQRDVLLCKGLIWQRCTLLPMARLQHVARQRGPLQRWFGLATVKLFSAGSNGAEIALRDMDSAQAEQLTLQLGLLLSQTIETMQSKVAATRPDATNVSADVDVTALDVTARDVTALDATALDATALDAQALNGTPPAMLTSPSAPANQQAVNPLGSTSASTRGQP